MELPALVLESDRKPLLETQTAVAVVEVDEKTPEKSLGDLLRKVPGLLVRSEGAGQRETVSIRAADGKQVAVLVEGVSVGDPRGGSVDLGQIPVEAVERIEVYRGGRGALAGEGALGGVVVVRLKRGAESRGQLRGFGGSFRTFGLEALGQSHGWLASVSTRSSEGDFPFIDTNGRKRTRTNNHSDVTRLAITGSEEVWDEATLRILALSTWTKRGSPGLEQFPSQTGKERQESYLASARLEQHRLGGNPLLSLDASLSWGAFRWLFKEPEPYFPPPSNTDSLSQRAESEVGVKWSPRESLELRLSAGARHEWSDVERLGSVETAQWNRTTASLVGGTTWKPVEWWTNALTFRLALADDTGLVWVPALESSVAFTQELGLSVTGARSWRQPQFDELYFEGSGIRGNPELSPESAWGVDASIWLELPWLRLNGSVFFQQIEDNILFLPKTPYLIQAQNADGVKSFGVEVSAAVSWKMLSLEAGGTWLRATLGSSETKLPLKPAWSTYVTPGLKWGPVAVSTTLTAQGSFYLDQFEGRSEESRLLLDARAAVEVGGGVTLSAEGKNLTNKRDALDAFQHPLPGVSFILSIAKSFSE